jgi:hypothetical protein
MDATTAIRVSMACTKIRSVSELARRTGIKSTTMHGRMSRPETLTLAELRQIAKVTRMSDELLLAVVKGGKNET